MDGHIRVQGCQKNPRGAVKKNLGEPSLSPTMPFLQSQKPLCTISAEELAKDDKNFNEVTFLCFANDSVVAPKELATVSVGLPDVLKSAQWCSLHDQEALLLKDVCKPAETSHDFRQKRNCASRVLCVMRLSPSFPRLRAETVVALLSKYAAAIRCTEEMHALPKTAPDSTHTENDDTNQSVSSIEDDFVTALEHLDEEDPAKVVHTEPEKNQEFAPSFAHHLKSNDQKTFITSLYRRPSVKSSISLVNILELEELSSSIRNPVSTSLSDPWIQRSFFRSHGSSDRSVNFLHKTLFSSSPADSSESDCSSPSPVIFLDEEGYQKSLKAKLQLPKIPVGKEGVEDSDSEISEFFDSFDQLDEREQNLEGSPKGSRDPTTASHTSQKSIVSCKKPCSTTSMNPQKFKCDRPVLPANVRKPTPRKPESPYNNLLDVPDSPRLIRNPADDHTALFSPVRSSAFSPLGTCFSTECLCRINRDSFSQNHNMVYHTYSDFANNISFEILGSVCNARPPSLCRCTQEIISQSRIVLEEEKEQTEKTQREIFRKGLHKKDKSKHKSGVIKDHIQKFASELVETSFGSAFKDLQKGVSSCTNALCQLAAKLTSSVFQMAFYEIGRQQALLLKKKAINGLAGFMVSEAVTGALKELYSMKQQMFTNTVTKFAANLAEELIFEGIMEVCQFSHPATPTASQQGFFQYDNSVVWSYARDLSESVIQDAFIELSQVDVSFTSQVAISVSTDNVQYVGTGRVVELTQTSSGSSELCEKVPVALNPAWEFRKERTINRALLYTSGIASSIPVPLAGSILSQHQILWNEAKVKNQSASETKLSFYKGPTETCCATRKNQSGVSSLRNIYLTTGFTSENECKPPDQPEASKLAEISSINNFSGTMVDMIVSEAYEAVTSSRVSKSAKQYTGLLQMKNTPYLQCIGKDSCKNMFANYLTKRIIKESVDETKSTCSATSEKLAYCVGLGTNARSHKKESQSVAKQGENTKNVPVIVGQQQMPLNNISKFHISTASPNRCLLLGCKDGVQEKKKRVVCKPSTSTLSPIVSFVKSNEQVPDVEDGSAIPISTLLEKQSTSKATGGSVFGREMPFSEINNCSMVPKCEDALQLDDKLSVGERNLLVITETPPSTPLIPSRASSEWNLRKLTKKLKGELAKEFAPATPPSTPYIPETDGIYTPECENLEKEEFMLKLIRSLSEEVENKEVEEQSATLIEHIQPSGPTIDYADHLATRIISMATGQASSRLQDKAILKNGYFQVSAEDKRRGYSTLVNVPEKNTHSLWIYAGEMAGRVIREAKKRVNSRQCKLLRLSQVNYEGDCFHLKRNYHECWSKDKRQKSCGREPDGSVLPVPLNSEALGLNSKYPSCESVTDEYTDHIIRILKQEGGHSDLIMDNFASRLAYKSVRSGIQQAASKLQVKYSRKISPEKSSRLNGKLELFEVAKQDVDLKNQKNSMMLHLATQSCRSRCPLRGPESSKLLDFSESLACQITSDARRTFVSTAGLPKSLTDSCLYQPSRDDKVTDFKATWTQRLSSSRCKQKLYHSTESLRDSTYQENVLQTIDQYAKKIVDDTLEVSLESALRQAPEGWTNGERLTCDKKVIPFSIAACKHCSLKERHSRTGGSSLQLAGQELPSNVRYSSDGSVNITLPKSHVLHLDIPKIHVNMDEKVVFAESLASVTLDRARRQLSNTSLTADSGISQDGISFAESLTTEIMTSCMTNIAPAINISAMETEGVNSAESVVSQHTADDSTGSWSNLSFDDEHPDESSSFLHLSDSNANSSSWSSLGLEGDLYEENLSFPTSDSDGTEDKEEELKDSMEEVRKPTQALVIVNVDVGPCTVDPQLRMTLQWLSASEADVAELRFHDDTPGEFVLLSKTLQEKGWRVGDLFQAVLKYCEAMEKSADGDRGLESKTLFVWLQEHV